MGTISRLEEYPHLVDSVFIQLSYRSLMAARKVNPLWERMINNSYENIWKNKRKNGDAGSPIWKILAARLEDSDAEMFNRMKNREVSSYLEACDRVQQSIQKMSRFEVENYFGCHLTSFRFPMHGDYKVDVNNVYVYGWSTEHPVFSKITIINRWTRKGVHEIFFPESECVIGIQVSDRFLAARTTENRIVFFKLGSFEQVRDLKTARFESRNAPCFWLGSEMLVNWERSKTDELWVVVTIHRLNLSTGQFCSDTTKVTSVNLEHYCYISDIKAYVDQNFLIVDAYASTDLERIIIVHDINSLKQITKRHFKISYEGILGIKQECHNGVIVVETSPTEGKAFLTNWDVRKDTFQPIVNITPSLMSWFVYTASMSPSHQYVLSFGSCRHEKPVVNIEMFSRDESHCFDQSSLPRRVWETIPVLPFALQDVYFDGVQCIYPGLASLNFVEFVE